MTQRQRVYSMLKAAGSAGIRSDHFFRMEMPRAAARVKELRNEGIQIDRKREGRFVRYKLAGVSTGVPSRASADSGECIAGGRGEPSLFGTGAADATTGDAEPERLFEPPVPSPFTDREAA